jgi:hypothetical protein
MRQSRAQAEDHKFEAERNLRYCGSARVSLDVIHFRDDQLRELDEKHVESLIRQFRVEGCRRENVKNHIPVLISQSCLEVALRVSGLSAAALLNNTNNGYRKLQLPRGSYLTCLHGKHRIQAGREFLSPREKWWVADVYLAGEIVHDWN